MIVDVLQTRMSGNAQRDGRTFGGPKLRSYCSPFVEKNTWLSRHRSLQWHFPSDHVLLRSGDIRDSGEILIFWGRQFFGGRGAKFLIQFHESGSHQRAQKLATIAQETS